MSEQYSILILTSKTGGGHVSLAEALRDRLIDHYAVEIIDPQPGLFDWHYRLVSRYALQLWAAEYRFTDTPAQALRSHRLFTRLIARRLSAALQRLRPALIISTYPFFTYEVMQILEWARAPIPFAMLFSDPDRVHASWLTELRAAATLAPTRETYAQALAAGFPPERLHLVGWPLRKQFYHDYEQQRGRLLTEIGLEPERFTIFLQGGGEGAARFGTTVERVLSISRDVQVILAAGTNRALLKRFTERNTIYPLPFIREIAPFMAAADVVMGKAGPNTLFEAVALGKPFIATAYIPGQEEANLEFIRRHQLGWVALEAGEQCALLAQLVADRTALQAIASSVAAYRQWNVEANAAILPLVRDLILSPRP
jgi:UDP-N-acetylglucosamine:LPS N-acetylglucosamine transferase